MLGFFITGIIISLTAGLFFSIMLTASLKNSMKKYVLTIFLALLFGFGACVLPEFEHQIDLGNWNNGICEKCNDGKYELVTVSQSRMGAETYYYTCNECGYTIETSAKMNN